MSRGKSENLRDAGDGRAHLDQQRSTHHQGSTDELVEHDHKAEENEGLHGGEVLRGAFLHACIITGGGGYVNPYLRIFFSVISM